MSVPVEIERKFLIYRPTEDWLAQHCGERVYEICQTYLSGPAGSAARVRARTCGGKTVYLYTVKRRLTDRSCQEQEEEISRERYEQLLQTALPDRSPLHKRRCCLPYAGFVYEIDLYDFWPRIAVMEVELPEEDTAFPIPPDIRVLREVTGDPRFSNLALAKEVPALSLPEEGAQPWTR